MEEEIVEEEAVITELEPSVEPVTRPKEELDVPESEAVEEGE